MNAPSPIDPAQLTDLLWEDKDGSVRDAAVERLAELGRGVKRALDAGVSPKEFEALNKVHDSIETAQKVVQDSWALMQNLDEDVA